VDAAASAEGLSKNFYFFSNLLTVIPAKAGMTVEKG